MVVDGSDLVDLDAQDLLDVLSSWEGQRPPVPPGMRVACAPDRRKHEEWGGLGVSWGRLDGHFLEQTCGFDEM
jgi:hypothetical protein